MVVHREMGGFWKYIFWRAPPSIKINTVHVQILYSEHGEINVNNLALKWIKIILLTRKIKFLPCTTIFFFQMIFKFKFEQISKNQPEHFS